MRNVCFNCGGIPAGLGAAGLAGAAMASSAKKPKKSK